MFGKIRGIGVEIEGPWSMMTPMQGVSMKKAFPHIQSFHNEWFDHKPQGVECMLKECVSDILYYPKHIDTLFAGVSNYLLHEHVKLGMGMHIHFSFKDPKYYHLLFSEKFVEEFKAALLEEYKDDAAFQSRLGYKSNKGTDFYKMTYPKNYWLYEPPATHSKASDGPNRFYIINFRRAFNAHKTFEIRIFPTTDPKTMRGYLQWTIDFINAYIKNNDGEEQCKFETNVEPSSKQIYKIMRPVEELLEDEIELI